MKASRMLMRASALAVAALAAAAQAQVTHVQPSTSAQQAARSPNAQQAANFGLPRPGGLTSPFPAGLTAGSGPAAAADPGVPAGAVVGGIGGTGTGTATGTGTGTGSGTGTGTGTGTVVIPGPVVVGGGGVLGGGTVVAPGTSNAVAATAVMGAGTNLPPIAQSIPMGAGPWTPVEVARSFIIADANGDGELTRAEATRLAIMPMAFEQMDRNFDGVVRRAEYDDSMR